MNFFEQSRKRTGTIKPNGITYPRYLYTLLQQQAGLLNSYSYQILVRRFTVSRFKQTDEMEL
jgi:hypothetical protein